MKIERLNEAFRDKYALALHYQKHVAPNPADRDNEKALMSYINPFVYEKRAEDLQNSPAGLARSETDTVVGFMVSSDRAIKYHKGYKTLVVYNIETGETSSYFKASYNKYLSKVNRDFYAELPENQDNSNKSILESLIAYRNDALYGSGAAKLEDIIRFEMEELGNSDIPSTLLDNFNVLRAEGKDIENLIDLIDSGNFTEDNLGEEEINRNVNLLMDVIKRMYPEAKYGLWLGTKDSIDKNYEGNATAYKIEYEKPISDLDLSDQGCLFVYSKHPSNYKLNLNESNR